MVKLDGMTKGEMADVMAKYKIVSPVTGNPLSGTAPLHSFIPVAESVGTLHIPVSVGG